MPTCRRATRSASCTTRSSAPGTSRSRWTAELRRIGVTRLHLEQDAGKSLHDQDPARSLIDLNRSGVALMEIVSEPDIRSPEEAGAYLRKLSARSCAT